MHAAGAQAVEQGVPVGVGEPVVQYERVVATIGWRLALRIPGVRRAFDFKAPGPWTVSAPWISRAFRIVALPHQQNPHCVVGRPEQHSNRRSSALAAEAELLRRPACAGAHSARIAPLSRDRERGVGGGSIPRTWQRWLGGSALEDHHRDAAGGLRSYSAKPGIRLAWAA